MKENAVKENSKQLALIVIEHVQQMERVHEYVLSKQLLRCGTSIGANIREAIAAESKRDFLHKLQIALKEARECEYWIEILQSSKYKGISHYLDLSMSLDEVTKLLVSITKTVKHQLLKK